MARVSQPTDSNASSDSGDVFGRRSHKAASIRPVGSTVIGPSKGCLMFNDNGSFLLALFEFFLFFAWFMCLFWVLGDIFRSRDLGGGAKTLWVIFVIIIPWLGILLYLIIRGHGMQDRQLEQARRCRRRRRTTSSPSPHVLGQRHQRDRRRQGPARQRDDHPGGVRPDQGQGARFLIRPFARPRWAASATLEWPAPRRPGRRSAALTRCRPPTPRPGSRRPSPSSRRTRRSLLPP